MLVFLGGYTHSCSALKEIHIYNPLLLKQAGFGHDVKVIME